MTAALFDIIFRGDIVHGHSIVDVKQRMAQLFKTDVTKIDSLFHGGAVPLKRNLDQATAEKYQAVLLKAGAQIEIRAVAAAKPAVASPEPAAPRVEAEAQARPRKPSPEPVAALAQSAVAALSLAAVGSDVLSASERHEPTPVSVDTSHLSVKSIAGGNLLDDNERPADLPAVSVDPHFDMAAVGSELLSDTEKAPVVSVQVDLGSLDIEALGGDLLHADEKRGHDVAQVDTGGLDMAPVGSDMGQVQKAPPPSAPDTSHIGLTD